MIFNTKIGKWEKINVTVLKPYLKGEGKKCIKVRTKLYKEFIPNSETRLIEKICLKLTIRHL